MFRHVLPLLILLCVPSWLFAKEKDKPEQAPAAVALKVGEKAPSFSMPAFPGGKATLKDYKGKWLVLVFYPKAFAPKDVTQMVSLRESWKEIKELDADVLGVSMDPPNVAERFQKEQNLPFRLASDTSKQVSTAYGALGLGNLFSSRRAFFINPEGTLAGTLDKFSEKKFGEQVVGKLKELQQKPPEK